MSEVKLTDELREAAMTNELHFLEWMEARGYLWPWQQKQLDDLRAERRSAAAGRLALEKEGGE